MKPDAMLKGLAMRANYKIVFNAIAVAALIVGCTTTPEGEQQTPAPVTEASKPGAAKPGAVPETGRIPSVDVTAKAQEGKDPRLKQGALAQRSIYYDLDQFDVRDEYRGLVEAHAKYLRENPSARILIQGNTDERGSREYNVGLGQRRSDGVKKMLIILGARENQIESVSLGEEKPQAEGHNEEAWSKNRRSDILYNGEF
jgi:peptidoglycan-associated lipoprotein